jgi:hypothetical protein
VSCVCFTYFSTLKNLTSTCVKMSYSVLYKVHCNDLPQGILQRPCQSVLQRPASRCLTASLPKCLTASSTRCIAATCPKVSYSVLTEVSYSILAKLSYSDLRLSYSNPRQCVLVTLLFCDPCHGFLQWLMPLYRTIKCATISYRGLCHCVLCSRHDCTKFHKSSMCISFEGQSLLRKLLLISTPSS